MVEKTVYITNDLRQFEDKNEAAAHEKSTQATLRSLLQILNMYKDLREDSIKNQVAIETLEWVLSLR